MKYGTIQQSYMQSLSGQIRNSGGARFQCMLGGSRKWKLENSCYRLELFMINSAFQA